MDFISSSGVMAGPIQLNGNNHSDNGKVWLTVGDNGYVTAAHFCKTRSIPLTSAENYFPIFAATPSYTEDTWDHVKQAVATMEWVASNFTSSGGEVPAFNPSDYVKATDFKTLSKEVEQIADDIKLLENKSDQIDKNKQDIKALQDYTKNPFPDGVIFIAGGAEV